MYNKRVCSASDSAVFRRHCARYGSKCT